MTATAGRLVRADSAHGMRAQCFISSLYAYED